MGKKEQLEELDKQLNVAKKKIRSANIGTIGFLIILVIGFLMPILWLFAIILLVLAIVNYSMYTRRINEINLEKAKLK